MFKNQLETVKYLDQLGMRTSQDHLLVDVPRGLSPFLGMQILQNWVDSGSGAACMVVPRPHLVSEMIDVAAHMGITAVSAEQSGTLLNYKQVSVVSLRTAISNLPLDGCLVFFEAGQCADELVNLFTMNIPFYTYLYDEVKALFDPSSPMQSDHPFDVASEDWIRQADHVKAIIRDYEAYSSLEERFQLLEGIFSSCRCSISSSTISITATDFPKRQLGVLASAAQRVFLVPPEVDRIWVADVFDVQDLPALSGAVDAPLSARLF